eukprot:TRINITY_DN5160_c0_g1_i3.p1 TRINITY_DN5160_c0_g1~~TRINITY_DN5160_c0_g1_i3.p1  ORF type:complete len:123 (-),score=9.89 TRINITY_DN5160_c0_g1_i3:62-430(-)
MYCAGPRLRSTCTLVPSTNTTLRRGLSRRERAANILLREKLDRLGVLEPKHEIMRFRSLTTEYSTWRRICGPLPVQKRHLLRQILALNPKRVPTYRGYSVAELKAELAELHISSTDKQLEIE